MINRREMLRNAAAALGAIGATPAIDEIAAHEEELICLLVRFDPRPTTDQIIQAREYIRAALRGTKWENVPVLVTGKGATLEAIKRPR